MGYHLSLQYLAGWEEHTRVALDRPRESVYKYQPMFGTTPRHANPAEACACTCRKPMVSVREPVIAA